MSSWVISFILIISSSPAIAAQSKDHWYNVETEKDEKEIKNVEEYPYDSVDSPEPKPVFAKTYLWNLRPKVSFSGGFHADKRFFETGESNRFFLNTNLHFRNRPWHRWVANIQLMQNNSLFLGASWEMTPSRKASRFYYGGGLSHRLISEKELGNFVEGENFYVNLQLGREILLSKDRAWTVEIKGMASSDNHALQLSFGYLFTL